MTRWIAGSLLILVGLVALPPRAALAMSNPRVQDNAGFFSADAVTKANEQLAQIKKDYGKDLYIETQPSIPDELKAQFDRDGKDRFFPIWADMRGKALQVNGIVVLICRDPSYLQVRVGKQTIQQAFIQKNADELRAAMIERFKAKDFDGGLQKGVNYVADTFAQSLPKRSGGAAAQPSALPSRRPPVWDPSPVPSTPSPTFPVPSRKSFSFGSLLCMVIGALILFTIIKRVITGARGASPFPIGRGYGAPNYGGGGAYPPGGYPPYGGGGGGGRGFLGGLLGGVLGGYAYDRWTHGSQRSSGWSNPPPQDSGGTVSGGGSGGMFDSSSDSSDFGSGGGGGSGGDFGGGGGGDSGGGGGGGGGDSGGSGGSGGDF